MEITRVAPFLEYLDRIHERTRRVIMAIPPADLEWAPAPGKFGVGDLVRHLATIERFMCGETVHGRTSDYPGHGRELGRWLRRQGTCAPGRGVRRFVCQSGPFDNGGERVDTN